MDLTDERLGELEGLALQATGGDWLGDGSSVWAGGGDVPVCDLSPHVLRPTEQLWTDREYIAAADPPTVLALIAEVRRLRAERAAAVADERERCARIAEGLDPQKYFRPQSAWGAARFIAATIRAAVPDPTAAADRYRAAQAAEAGGNAATSMDGPAVTVYAGAVGWDRYESPTGLQPLTPAAQ